jgi:HEAT repeats
MPESRLFGFVAILGAAISVGMAASPLAAAQQTILFGSQAPDIGFEPATGEVSGRIEAGQSVAGIARQLGSLACVDLEIHGDPGGVRWPITLDGLDIEAALERIAEGHSLIVTYGPAFSGSRTDVAGPAIRGIVLIANTNARGPDLRAEQPAKTEIPVATDADPQIARAVAQRDIVALSYSGGQHAIEQLGRTAIQADDPALRRAAMSSLVSIAGHQSLTLFRQNLARDADDTVRIEAARSILRVDYPRGRPIVEAAARREKEPSVRDIMLRLARGESVERTATTPQGLLRR